MPANRNGKHGAVTYLTPAQLKTLNRVVVESGLTQSELFAQVAIPLLAQKYHVKEEPEPSRPPDRNSTNHRKSKPREVTHD
jgi:hypothetical protein